MEEMIAIVSADHLILAEELEVPITDVNELVRKRMFHKELVIQRIPLQQVILIQVLD